MAIIYGEESVHIKKNERKHNIRWTIWFGLLIVVLLVYVFNLKTLFGAPFLIAISVPLICLLIFRLVDPFISKEDIESRKWYRGMRGEEETLLELKKLPDDYVVFQGLKIYEIRDIDFVVVGPNGVFTIETKSHKGKIGFNGDQLTKNGFPFEKDILEQALHGALRVRDYLKAQLSREIFVTSLVVFACKSAYMHFGQKPVKHNIYVIQKKWLLELIGNNFNNIGNKEEIVDCLKKLIPPSP